MPNDLFEQCQTINAQLNKGQDTLAREYLIKLLAKGSDHGEHTPLVNHLIRQTGLFPYLQGECIWQDRLVQDLFTVDVGGEQPVTLHREQSAVLKELLNGQSLVLSAPTSFGKSFIIDALIAIKKPKNVLIIVPTIALLDECRRRIFKKFSSSYKIISTAGCVLAERNILVLTAERALHYANALKEQGLNVLIVDEFYKIDSHDERAHSLQLLVSRIGAFAQQRYFLAPNIKHFSDSFLFTKDMKFIEKLDFSTVFLNKTEVFKLLPIGLTKKGNKSSSVDLEAKNNYLVKHILNKNTKKTLIYAGSYAQIKHLSELINSEISDISSTDLKDFSIWIASNYHPNWGLAKLAQKGYGWHNGRLHRSLAQIQIKLFEERNGLRGILCTSSVIEGVNTQAEQVVLWSNKNGSSKITTFEYKNIMGRAGRMLKYFVGDVFVMETPPKENDEEQLNLSLDEQSTLSLTISDEQTSRTPEQISEIIRYKEEMSRLFGGKSIEQLIRDGVFQTADKAIIEKIAFDMRDDSNSWNGLANLNNANPMEWERFIKKMIFLANGRIVQWKSAQKFCDFTCTLFNYREQEVKELISTWSQNNRIHIDEAIDEIFEWERKVSFNLATLAQDIETIYNLMHPNKAVNISHFYNRASFAFLHPVIYQLEEYGLPRMIANKIHASRLIDLKPNNTAENAIEIGGVIKTFQQLGVEKIYSISNLDNFDRYIIKHFFEGIEQLTVNEQPSNFMKN